MYNECEESDVNFEQIRQFAPQILQIARKYGISRVFVFGSVARGDESPQSDVDFLVDLQGGASFFGVAGFGYETGQLLGMRVDVVPRSALPRVSDRAFVDNVQKEAVLVAA